MMDIKCCVFDLDGTLLTSSDRISPGSIDAFARMQAKGIYPVIATGRTDLQIFEYVDILNIRGPVITCNGGYIKNMYTGDEISSKTFEREKAAELVGYCRERGLDHLLYHKDYIYYSPGSQRIMKFVRYNQTAKPEHRVPIRAMEDFGDDVLFTDTLKVLIIGDDSRRLDVMEKFNQNNDCTMVMSGDMLIDIMPGHTTKGEGVCELARALGIELSQVAVFGDNFNDESMFRVAGLPIAMGNAEDEIKALAKFVTRTNDEDGILYALEHFNII